jgi:hypothetical protein
MAERTFIPSSPACGAWETLLADALDGLLTPEQEQRFRAHMAICPACTALYEESRKGLEWLEFLSPEPEAPAGLVDRILAATGPGQVAGYGLLATAGAAPAAPQPWQRPGFMGAIRRFAEPRLMMTAAMAFFSIALTLNLTGVKLTAFHVADLKPSSIRAYMERQFTMASSPIIRYYDHLRLVYEVETRMRELRKAPDSDPTPAKADPTPGESRQNPGQAAPVRKDGGASYDPPQQSVTPSILDEHDFNGTTLTKNERPAHPGGPRTATEERS